MVLVRCTYFDNALYLYQVLKKYLRGFVSYCADTISTVKFAKGHNSVKMLELWFLFSAHPLMMLYICTKVYENILKGVRVIKRT